MANYIVSYDLNGKTPTHADTDKHMGKAGWEYGRVLETVWYVGTKQTQKQVYDHINAILSANDRLLVVTASSATFRNLLTNDKSLLEAWSRNQ